MSGPPPPPSKGMVPQSALRPSARARLQAAPQRATPTHTTAAATSSPDVARESSEEALNATRVGNHFISQVTPSNSDDEGVAPPPAPQRQTSEPKAAPAPARTKDVVPTTAPVAATPVKSTSLVPTANLKPEECPPAHEAPTPDPPQPATSPSSSARPQAVVATIGEKDVLGFGLKPNVLQLPSPVYMAEWVDETHIMLGAGGGGRRFGMANLLTILAIDTTARQPAAGGGGGAGGKASRRAKGKTSSAQGVTAEGRVARFVCAVELGDDIPWCCSRFLRYDPAEAALDGSLQAQVAKHCPDLVGFFAVSSIKCFYLVGICRGAGPTSAYTMRLFARIVIPNDDRNPDKKPIALVHNALVVAHDDAGVLAYRLGSLLPPLSAPAAVNGPQDGQNLVDAAVPMASWKLHARANDLHANRVNLVCAKKPGTSKQAHSSNTQTPAKAAASHRTPSRGRGRAADDDGAATPRFVLHSPSPARGGASPGQASQAAPADASDAASPQSCRALLLNYLVIVAAVQDKTVRVGSVRLRRSPGRDEPGEVVEQMSLTGTDLGLGFPLMGSSLRLVRLFGLQDLSASGQALARRALVLRDLGELPVTGAAGESGTALASLLVVVFNMHDNQSYFVQLNLDATLEKREAAAGHPDSRHGSLRLRPRMTVKPAPLIHDSITCLSAVPGVDGSSAQAASSHVEANLFGAAVPQEWLVGSVDGLIARVEAPPATPTEAQGRSGTSVPFIVTAIRPAKNKNEAKKFPPLHTEPVSCVAVSPSGVDVVTTDIVQNVIISTLPAAEPLDKIGAPKGDARPVARWPGIRLFPPQSHDEGILSLLGEFSPREKTALMVLLSILVILLAMMLS